MRSYGKIQRNFVSNPIKDGRPRNWAGGVEDGDRQTGREWAGWLPGRYAGLGSAVSLNELCFGFSCTSRTGVCLQCRINRKLQHLERSGGYQWWWKPSSLAKGFHVRAKTWHQGLRF